MGVLEDCLEFLNMVGPGKVLFRTGAAGAPIQTWLRDLIAAAPASDGVQFFVAAPDATSPGLRDYLHNLFDKGTDVVVTLVDPERQAPVTDLPSLQAAQGSLGVPVTVPQSDDVPVAYRLLPDAMTADRDKLRDLADHPAPVGPQRLREWLSHPSGTPGAADRPLDLSALLGVHQALSGQEPEGLDDQRPLARAGLEQALGGTFTPITIQALTAELTDGPATGALIRGFAPGSAYPSMFWLVKDGSGALHWADPYDTANPYSPAVLNGAEDPRAQIVEQPHTTALLIGGDHLAYVPEVTTHPAPPPFVSIHARVQDNVTMVGPEPGNGVLSTILDAANRYGGPVTVANVRRGPTIGGNSSLDPMLEAGLNETLKRATAPRLVLATEGNDQLDFLVDLYDGAVVRPSLDGLGMVWDVKGPRNAPRERFANLTDAAVTRGAQLAVPPSQLPPEAVRSLLSSPTWADAENRFTEYAIDLRTPGTAALLADLLKAEQERGMRPSPLGSGPAKDHPFFVPDRTLPAFKTIVDVSLQTPAGPSITPQNGWLTDPIRPHPQPLDYDFMFGYLTDRALDSVKLGVNPGQYVTGLLWLREMVQAMNSGPDAGITAPQGLSVIRAKGELEGERAVRRPGHPEVLRAHATVAEALVDIVDPNAAENVVDNWRKLVEAIDCLTGQDRVAWHYIFENVVLPAHPNRAEALKSLLDIIVTCY